MRWFGEPWPRADYRAPACEDDDLRVPVPVGKECVFCGEPIEEGDRGVMIPHLTEEWLSIEAQAHLNCLLSNFGVPGFA